MPGYWFHPGSTSFVAEKDGEVVGTFNIKENQPDLGSHVANALYMISLKHWGKVLAQFGHLFI
jgi:hypothetical protein